MNEPDIIWDMDQALADLRELRELAVIYEFDLFEFLSGLENRGTVLFQIDDPAAIRTGNRLVRYKLADEALVCLAALRARHIHSVNVESGSGHSPLHSEGGQLTPDGEKPPHGGVL